MKLEEVFSIEQKGASHSVCVFGEAVWSLGYSNFYVEDWRRKAKAWNSKISELRAQKEWIPVSEGLPEYEGWWLVTLDWSEAGKIFTHRVYFRDGQWDLSDVVQRPVKVTAYQQQPKPYQPEQGEAK